MARKYLPSQESSWPTLFLWAICPIIFLVCAIIFVPILVIPTSICLGIGVLAALFGFIFKSFGVVTGLGILWLAAFIIFIWMLFI